MKDSRNLPVARCPETFLDKSRVEIKVGPRYGPPPRFSRSVPSEGRDRAERELSQSTALAVGQAAETLENDNHIVNTRFFTLALLCFMVEFKTEKVVQQGCL